MKENNLLAIRYFRTLIKNGWVEPKRLTEELRKIEKELENTKELHRKNLLKTQKIVISEALK